MSAFPRSRVTLGAVALTAFLALAGWLFLPAPRETGSGASARPEAPLRAEATEPAEVAVAPARRQDLALLTEATGALRPWRVSRISAEAGGEVRRRAVEEGDWVEAAQLLLELDPTDAQLELEAARAELLKVQADFAISYAQDQHQPATAPARPQHEAARQDYEKKRELFAQGLVSQRELDASRQRHEALRLLSGERRHEVQAATSGLAQTEQRVKSAELALARTRIAAPFPGRIADLACEEGEHIAAGQECLVLLDDARLKADVDVLEQDLVRLRRGGEVVVSLPALDGARLAGRIVSINPQIDRDTGTGRVTVAIPNPDRRLISGLFAFVQLQTRRLEDRVVVPREAVLERQGREVVFVLVDGRARWRYVETGARTAELVEVTGGLEPGELVAVRGHQTLAHDSPVTTVPFGG